MHYVQFTHWLGKGFTDEKMPKEAKAVYINFDNVVKYTAPMYMSDKIKFTVTYVNGIEETYYIDEQWREDLPLQVPARLKKYGEE